MRLLRSRPSGVVLGAMGSASALPSALSRAASPTLGANIAAAAFARAVAGDAQIQPPFTLPFRRGDRVLTVGWAILRPQPAFASH